MAKRRYMVILRRAQFTGREENPVRTYRRDRLGKKRNKQLASRKATCVVGEREREEGRPQGRSQRGV